MTTARDIAVMRRLIRRGEDEPLSSGRTTLPPTTREGSIEVAAQIARAGGVCPIPRTADGNREVFDLLSSGWLRFWPPGRPTTLRLDPELLAAFLAEVES